MFKLWKLAMRNLRRNKRRSGLTLIAVMMGLALVIVLNGFQMGAIDGAIENNIRLQTGHLQVRDASYDEDELTLTWEDLIADPQAIVAQGQALAEVQAAAPVLWASGILAVGEESVRVQASGIAPQSGISAPYRESLVDGEFLTPDDRRGLLIGKRLADSLDVSVGQDVSLMVNTSEGQPDEAIFTVRGLYHTGIPAFDEGTIFLPLAKAQAFTRVRERASAVVVLLHDRQATDMVAAALQASGMDVLTWRDLNRVMLEIAEAGMGFWYMVYLVVLAIVAVVVANTLLMSVFERTREMGILAAMGMKGRQIMAMILTEAAILGVMGIILGVLLGSLGVYYLATEGFYLGDVAGMMGADLAMGERIYAAFLWADTALLALVCWIIILLASLYPAWFATRKEPIEALREQ